MRLLAALLAGLSLCGCSASAKSRRLEGRYELGDPGSGWRVVQPGGADHAWFHEDLGASIYADSNCGVRYEDADLDKLAEKLTLGLEGEAELSAEEGTLGGRASYTRRVQGEIDGVGVEITATVLKKDQCVYDFVLIAPPGTAEAAWAGFVAARGGFSTRGE